MPDRPVDRREFFGSNPLVRVFDRFGSLDIVSLMRTENLPLQNFYDYSSEQVHYGT